MSLQTPLHVLASSTLQNAKTPLNTALHVYAAITSVAYTLGDLELLTLGNIEALILSNFA